MKKYLIIITSIFVILLMVCLFPKAGSYFSDILLADRFQITKAEPIVLYDDEMYIGDVDRVDFTKYLDTRYSNITYNILGYDYSNPIIDDYTVEYHATDENNLSATITKNFTFWGFTQFATGGFHTLGLTSKGEIYSWGANDYGQLGLGDNYSRYVPTLINGIPKMKDIACTFNSSFSIDENGILYTWGRDIDGVLAGRGGDFRIPAAIGGTFLRLAGGGYNTMGAIKSDGNLYSWGNGIGGALGNGQSNQINMYPIRITGSGNVALAQYSFNGGMYTTTSGDLYLFGSNEYGELAKTDYSIRKQTPTKFDIFTNVVKLAAGYGQRFVLLSTNRVYSWGNSRNNRVGHNVEGAQRPSPSIVSAKAIDVASNIVQAMVLNNDGTILTFGDNFNGQNASGNTNYTSTNYTYTPTFSVDKIYCLDETNLFFAKHQMYGVGKNDDGVIGNNNASHVFQATKWVFSPSVNVPYLRRMSQHSILVPITKTKED